MKEENDVIENSITGEKIIFCKTSEETNGEYLTYEYYSKPNQPISPKHFHPEAKESFEVLRGIIRFNINDEIIDAKEGDYIVINPGVAHTGYNIGNEEAYLKARIEPALHYEQYYRTTFQLASMGKVNKKGLPSILQLAVMGHDMKNEMFLPKAVFAQKMFFKVFGAFAKFLGYKSDLSK
ncbi:cupin domain-containing protein [Clostridium sp. C8-1-8]|uniref:cupin domain-containing protein n=1 Tax=Clostridium sp. C8-1-8 TaxID=2698831 RepID=UPI001371BBFE|nr:cupin domain-containing protein [Clostridium sp. C8-1-8]